MVRPVMMQLQGVSFLPAATTANPGNGDVLDQVGILPFPSLYSRNINGYQVSIFPADQLGNHSLSQLFGSGPVTVNRTNDLNRALFLSPGASEPEDYSPTSHAGMWGAGLLLAFAGAVVRGVSAEAGRLYRRVGPEVEYPAPNPFERAHFEALIERAVGERFSTPEARTQFTSHLTIVSRAIRRDEGNFSSLAGWIEVFERYLSLHGTTEAPRMSQVLEAILKRYGSVEAAQEAFSRRLSVMNTYDRNRMNDLFHAEHTFLEIISHALERFQNPRSFLTPEAEVRFIDNVVARLAGQDGVRVGGDTAVRVEPTTLDNAGFRLVTAAERSCAAMSPIRRARLAILQDARPLPAFALQRNYATTPPAGYAKRLILTLETNTQLTGVETPEALIEAMLRDLESQEITARIKVELTPALVTEIAAERSVLLALQESYRALCEMPAVTVTSGS